MLVIISARSKDLRFLLYNWNSCCPDSWVLWFCIKELQLARHLCTENPSWVNFDYCIDIFFFEDMLIHCCDSVNWIIWKFKEKPKRKKKEFRRRINTCLLICHNFVWFSVDRIDLLIVFFLSKGKHSSGLFIYYFQKKKKQKNLTIWVIVVLWLKRMCLYRGSG